MHRPTDSLPLAGKFAMLLAVAALDANCLGLPPAMRDRCGLKKISYTRAAQSRVGGGAETKMPLPARPKNLPLAVRRLF